MKFRKFLTAAVLLAAALLVAPAARAQFYVVGDDPASIRWYSIRTEHYRIVYPAGLDSLARAYGRSLEQFRPVVGNTVGHAPAQYNRRGVPVILHSFNAISNGSVAWAPKRMDLYTSPQAYSPEPMPWIDNLTIHEQRHVSQMQVGLSPGTFRALGYVFGEMLDGAVAGIYLTSYIEGDAVVAETAFSRSGRGRTADFLNYYMIAFDNGDMRSLQRWRLGSQTRYAPDKYAFGYMQLSTMRYLFGNSTFLAEYYEHMARRPYDIGGFGRILRPQTGGLGERALFKVVTDTLRIMWGEEIAARAPYTPHTDVTPHERRYTEYTNSTHVGNDIYAVRSGITRPAALVRISPDGNVKTLRAFASVSSKLTYDPVTERLYWSEYAYNRWSLKTKSIIRYYDLSLSHDNVTAGTLTRRGRLFNPAASPDGTLLSAVQYLDDGRSALVILNSGTGAQAASKTAPDSLQIVESAWIGDKIYVSAISKDGFGIYSIQYKAENQSDTYPTSNGTKFTFVGTLTEELAPQPAKMDGFQAAKGRIHFSSDRLGVKELYCFNPSDKMLYKLTSSKYGADDYAFNAAGDTLYYSLKQYEGNYIVSTPVSELFDPPPPPDSLYKWKIADELTRQETALAARKAAGLPIYEYESGKKTDSLTLSQVLAAPDTIPISEPQRYRKAGHIFNIHSWAPVYFNVDNIMNMSYDYYYSLASLGLAAISQNQLGTAITQFGYSAHQDPYDWSHWKNSGHATFTYTGWYPVFEVSVDFNDRNAIDYAYTERTVYNYDANTAMRALSTDWKLRGANKPYVTGYVSVYIPFNFTRGGWSTGLIPQLTYSLSNDSLTKISESALDNSGLSANGFAASKDAVVIMQRLTASLRGYTMRPTADSGVYPRLGIGAQLGVSLRPGLTEYYSPAGFLYIYGYTPGFSRTQGLSLSYRVQTKLNRNSWLGDSVISVLPRGFNNSTLTSYAAWYSDAAMKFTADYTIPISTGDVPIGGYLFYFSRLILTPHFDYTFFRWSRISPFSGSGLWSAGASLAIDFRSFFWIKYPIQLGVTCSFNGGSAFSDLNYYLSSSYPLSRFYIGPVFSISI